mgnify:CR=1 FL=1
MFQLIARHLLHTLNIIVVESFTTPHHYCPMSVQPLPALTVTYVSDILTVDDIVQDSIVSLYGKIDILKPMPDKVLAGYIVSTVRNTAINRLRVKEYEKDHIAEFTEENVSGADRYVPMETLLILAERRKALLDIWPVLPKETQILLKGKYILGYTDQELACQLKCKPSSIRMKLTRARRAALLLLSERNEVKEHDKT